MVAETAQFECSNRGYAPYIFPSVLLHVAHVQSLLKLLGPRVKYKDKLRSEQHSTC